MKNKKQPEIRFAGFEGEWEERKAKDLFVAKVKKGYPDLPVLSVTQTSGVVYRDEVGIDIKYDTSSLSSYKVVEPSDFIISLRSFQGGFELSDKLGITSPAYTIFVPKEFKYQNKHFWSIKFKTFKFIESLKSVTFGIRDGKSISFNEFGDLNLKFAKTVEEQQKIGQFFKQLDQLISLQQRKVVLLQEQKKGFLQKMFPKAEAKVPEVRFAGFTDEWEERKLGEIADIVGGGTPNTNSPEYWDGYINWYSPVEIGDKIYVDGSQKKITELGLQKSSARMLPVGTVLFTSRAGIGNTAILAREGCTNQGFQSIIPYSDELDSYFIFSRTNELKHYGEINGAGSTFIEISGKQMAKMPISVPNLKEQQKIGSFFKQLDEAIACNQKELELLKEMKKGFLQKMFV